VLLLLEALHQPRNAFQINIWDGVREQKWTGRRRWATDATQSPEAGMLPRAVIYESKELSLDDVLIDQTRCFCFVLF
jgi:hypothetical protein